MNRGGIWRRCMDPGSGSSYGRYLAIDWAVWLRGEICGPSRLLFKVACENWRTPSRPVDTADLVSRLSKQWDYGGGRLCLNDAPHLSFPLPASASAARVRTSVPANRTWLYVEEKEKTWQDRSWLFSRCTTRFTQSCSDSGQTASLASSVSATGPLSQSRGRCWKWLVICYDLALNE